MTDKENQHIEFVNVTLSNSVCLCAWQTSLYWDTRCTNAITCTFLLLEAAKPMYVDCACDIYQRRSYLNRSQKLNLQQLHTVAWLLLCHCWPFFIVKRIKHRRQLNLPVWWCLRKGRGLQKRDKNIAKSPDCAGELSDTAREGKGKRSRN